MEKIKEIYLKISGKVNIKKLIALAVAVILVLQAAVAIVLNTAVLSKNGLESEAKVKELFHIELSEKKYIDWMNEKGEKEEIEGEKNHTLKAEKLLNYESSHTYIILSHPYGKLPSDMAEFAYHFYDLGFHVYLPYMRGFGESDYNSVSMGVDDWEDILKWVNHITQNDKAAKIFLFGMGLGGTASLLTADKDLPENVKGIIADSAYSDINAIFKNNIKELYSLPSFPIVQFGSLYNKLTKGWSYGVLDLKKSVQNTKVPILYIQGGEDQVVPAEQINDLYDVTTEENSDYIYIAGATHCENADFQPEKYWNGIDLFILNVMDL